MNTSNSIREKIDNNKNLQNLLYTRGFLITNSTDEFNMSDYPFYSNWRKQQVAGFSFYCHNLTWFNYITYNSACFFIVGHAYNPFTMEFEEEKILNTLAKVYFDDNENFWNAESELTGGYILGVIKDNEIMFSADATGMQISYYGTVDNSVFISSHSNLVNDLVSLEKDSFVDKLVDYKFYKLLGIMLPGDISPFKQLTRTQPNHMITYKNGKFNVTRYYPVKKLNMCKTEDDYQKAVKEIADIMNKNMQLIARKWNDKTVAISVTGGRDSLTSLACAKNNYNDYKYFSYISNKNEEVDAKAAAEICKKIGLKHEIYHIPLDVDKYPNLEDCKDVFRLNFGQIGSNHQNDVQKRLYFINNPHFDIEVKSWVDEIGRARYYKRFNKKEFVKYPTARNLTSVYKFFVYNRSLVKQVDKRFQDYLDKYYSNNEFDKIPWTDLFYWEFNWATKEALYLTSEHRISYEITIPFNNRKLLELMISTQLEKRIGDRVQIDVTDLMNPQINDTGINVVDVNHTDRRAQMEGLYYSINSILPF